MELDNLFCDLESLRTKSEMKSYFQHIKEITHDSDVLKKHARLKNGRYKQFLEEFYPLYLYSQSSYCDNESEMRVVLGNQQFDAIVRHRDESEEKFEFTYYVDGEWEFHDGKRLNDRGFGEIRFQDNNSLETRDVNYLSKIMKNVINKSNKDYSEVNILFLVNTFDFFEVYGRESKEFIDVVKHEILKIRFKAKRIFLLVVNNQGVENVDKNLYLLKEPI